MKKENKENVEQIDVLKKYGWIVATENEIDLANLVDLIFPLHKLLEKLDITKTYVKTANNNNSVPSLLEDYLKSFNLFSKKNKNFAKNNIDFLNATAICSFMLNAKKYENLKSPATKGHPLASLVLAKIYFRRNEMVSKPLPLIDGFSSGAFLGQSVMHLNNGIKQCNLKISSKQSPDLTDKKNKLLLEVLVCSPPYTYDCLTKIGFDNFCSVLDKLKLLPFISPQKSEKIDTSQKSEKIDEFQKSEKVDAFTYIRFMSKLINEFEYEKLIKLPDDELKIQFNNLRQQLSMEELPEPTFDKDLRENKSTKWSR